MVLAKRRMEEGEPFSIGGTIEKYGETKKVGLEEGNFRESETRKGRFWEKETANPGGSVRWGEIVSRVSREIREEERKERHRKGEVGGGGNGN